MNPLDDRTQDTTDDLRCFAQDTVQEASSGFRHQMLQTQEAGGGALAYTTQFPEPITRDKSQAAPLANLGTLAPVTDERFVVSGLLGQGGGGAVYAVEDSLLKRRIAWKKTHDHHRGRPEKQQALLREAYLTAGLEHPAILPVYDAGHDSHGAAWMAMRAAQGLTLGALLERAFHNDVDPRIAQLSDRIALILPICDALRYAHDHGVIHQDIKPANILIGDYGEVILLDWGAAIHLNEDSRGRLVGTPMYCSPEQARRERADIRSDIYCLGATLFHLITLRYPLIDGDASRFWDKKRNGHIDHISDQLREQIPEHLLRITLRCLEPDPARRPQNMGEVLQELRTWQRHEQAIRIAEKAIQAAERLKDPAPYGAYQHLSEQFRQALSLWSEQPRAQRGLARLEARHAITACQLGDLVMATTLLHAENPEHQAALVVLAQAQRQRTLRRWAAFASICMALFFVALAGYSFWQDRILRERHWQVIWEKNFLEPHTNSGVEHRVNGQWQPTDARRNRAGQECQASDLLRIADLHETGDIRISGTLRWPIAVDGFDIIVRALPEGPQNNQTPAGYLAQIGGYQGTVHILDALGSDGFASPVTSSSIANPAPKVFTFIYTVTDGEQILVINNVEVLRRHNLLPISTEQHDSIFLRSWSYATIDNLRIERRNLPARQDALQVPDALASHGLLASALPFYTNVAADPRNQALAGLATLRAQACALGIDNVDLADALYEELKTTWSGHPWIESAHSGYCLSLLKRGRTDEALALAKDILVQFPQSRVVAALLTQQETLRAHLQGSEQANQLVHLIAQSKDLVHVDLSDLPVSDLNALRGIPLRWLNLMNTQVSTLDALRGMPLTHLNCENLPIRDLSVLQGMPLVVLYLNNTQTADLSVLAKMPLVRLYVNNTRITSLDVCSSLDSLVVLEARNLPLTNSAGLRDLAKLAVLHCSGSPLDSSHLGGLTNLRQAGLNACQLDDLSWLKDSPYLNDLWVANNRLRSLAVVEHLGNLREVDVSHNHLSDLSPLHRAESLKKLDLAGNPLVTDLSPLANLTQLQHLNILKTSVQSLIPLQASALQRLIVQSDVQALRELPQISCQQITLYPPFDSTLLEYLLQVPPKQLSPNVRKSLRIALALAQNDQKALQGMARVFEDQLIVSLGMQRTKNEALALAAQFGSQLPLHNPQQPLKLGSLLHGTSAWVRDAANQTKLYFSRQIGHTITNDDPNATAECLLSWPILP